MNELMTADVAFIKVTDRSKVSVPSDLDQERATRMVKRVWANREYARTGDRQALSRALRE